MPASKESLFLTDLFKLFGTKFPADGDPFLTRCVYDQVHTAAAEVPGCHYESAVVGGIPSLWIFPPGASKRHVVLFFHGGGFSFGSPNGHRKLAAHLAAHCNATALSLDYRLTPDHPFPAAIEDSIAAYTWLLDHGYSAKNVVFAGDSCGGQLSTTVPLALRERGLPLPGASVSLSPWYDATYSQPSFQSNVGKDFINTLEGCTANADKYVAGGTSKTHPLVSPIFADLHGLNPHWISCAGDDMLRDDGVLLGKKAKAAGVEVVVEVHPDQQHVFEFMAGRAPEADASLRRIGEWVKGKIGS